MPGSMSSNYKEIMVVMLVIIVFNFFALVGKIYLMILSGSISALAYVIDTIIDIINNAIAYIGARYAGTPPDEEHPYGHIKFDYFASLIISVFIITGAIEIMRESIKKLIFGAEEIIFSREVLIISIILMVIYISISATLLSMYKKSKIELLKTAALHYISDPLLTLTVLIGIYLGSLGFSFIDILFSWIIVAILIKSALEIIKESRRVLLDERIIPAEVLCSKISEAFDSVVSCYDVRSRTDGKNVFLEFTIKLKGDLTLNEAHRLAHQVEKFIRDNFNYKFANIHIHYEPLD